MTDDKTKQKNSEVHPRRAINFKRIAEQLLGKTGEEKRRLLQEALKRRAEIAKSIKTSSTTPSASSSKPPTPQTLKLTGVPTGILGNLFVNFHLGNIVRE